MKMLYRQAKKDLIIPNSCASYCFIRWLVFCVVTAISFTSCFAKSDLDMSIAKILEDHHAIGASVAVVKDSSIVYSNTFGYNPNYLQPELREPIRSDGVFWIASVSKAIIGTAIMQLVEKKLLGLDDDINRYLSFQVINPKYPNVPITIRMLLNHRSSLNDTKGSRSFKNLMAPNTPLYSQSFSKSRPGSKFVYCNLGYNLLGAIIEGVVHERFDNYIEREILTPLGIKGNFDLTRIDSSLLVRSYNYDIKLKQFESSPFVYDYNRANVINDNYQLGKNTGSLAPAGGMKMRTRDLARFMMMLMNNGELNGMRILNRKSIEEMLTPQGDDRNYGLGLTTYSNIIKGRSLRGMRGGSHGIHSIMVYDQENNIGFVIINNGYDITSQKGADLNFRIVRLLFKYFKGN